MVKISIELHEDTMSEAINREFSYSAILKVILLVSVRLADAIFMWTAPPPAWNQTVPAGAVGGAALIQTVVIQVTNGTTDYPVRWNYTLLDSQTISIAFFSVLGTGDIGLIVNPGGVGESTTINNVKDYQTRFRLQSDKKSSTLTIITVNERENATFQCRFQVGSNQWAYNVRIEVTVPPSITHITGNQTVTEGQNVPLNCTASGYPAPNITWTRLSDNSIVTMPLINIRRQEEGGYRCTADNDIGSPATRDTYIIVQFPPNIADISENQTVNESNVVSLKCKVDGNPTPTITWTRLSDNSVVTMPFTITGKQDEGSYRCTADNGIGNPVSYAVFITVQNYRPTDTNLTTNLTNDTVVLNEPFNLVCRADANPSAHYRLYKEQQHLTTITDNQAVGTFTTSIGERIQQVTYSCTPNNSVGVGPSDTANVTVHYNPANVTLVANPTENENCSDLLRVKLTCVASDANPAVTSYQLYGGRKEFSASKNGHWSTEISHGGEYVYSCLAEHRLGNVTSSKNHTVSFNVPVNISVKVICGNETLKEGGNVSLYCDASGFPVPTVTWSKLGDDGFMNRNAWLNFTNITRNEAGNYACHAQNTCGKDFSSMRTVDVQFSPSATSSGRNETVPLGKPVTFTCPVDGNPPPSVRWHKGTEPSGAVLSSRKEFEFTPTSLSDTGLYTCFASNYLGNISVSFGLKVGERTSFATSTSTTPREMTVVQITLTITNKDCINFPEEEFRVEVQKTLEHLGIKAIEIETRCGSVIVDLGLGFNQSVGVNDVISTLKGAASDGKFGDFHVDSNSIRQTSSTSTSSPSPTTDAGCAQGCSCSCNTVLGVIIGILVAIIIVLIIIIVWQHKKGTTKRPYEVPPRDAGFYDNEIAMKDVSPTHIPSSSSTQKLNMSGPGYMDLQEATRSDKYRTGQSRPTTSQQQNPSQPAEYASLSLRTRSWELARDNVTIDKIIGKGAFGQVAKATAIQLPFSNGKTTVAVKMLKPNAPEADKKDLLSELELMKTLKPHPHIIKLMGCVTLSEPLLVLIEYVPYGDLLGYLRRSRGLNDTYYKDPDVKPRTSLTSQQLMKFAWQIADGMSYLSSRKIIHRDLAARNVLVGERETCKVTDFGMARDVQQENIYEKKTKGRLPVKWTAYESLLYGTYTTKSDVWSYGVVLYEIFTIGGSPYPRMDGKRIANALQHGYRMPKPQHVDDALYQIMMNCWQKEPEARPTFTSLTKQLKEMEKQHKRLINMHIYDNELYGNLEDLNV